jgi:predicted Zn-dependent peptidase
MVLSIAGNINADKVLEICDKCLKSCSDNGLETVFPEEPKDIVSPEVYEIMPVGASIFNIGYKCAPGDGIERLKRTSAACLALSLITDPAMPMYERLLKEGVINSTFCGEVFYGNGYFSLIFSGESDNPKLVRDSINAEAERLISEGISEKDFQRIKKSAYGMMIRELNNVEAVSNLMLNAYMDNVGPYDAIDVLYGLTRGDVTEFMQNEMNTDRCVLSVIEKEA